MYSVCVDDCEFDAISHTRDIVACLASVTQVDCVAESTDVLPNKETTVPSLNPMERLSSMILNETLFAGHRGLKTIRAATHSIVALRSAIAGRSNACIKFCCKNGLFNF